MTDTGAMPVTGGQLIQWLTMRHICTVLTNEATQPKHQRPDAEMGGNKVGHPVRRERRDAEDNEERKDAVPRHLLAFLWVAHDLGPPRFDAGAVERERKQGRSEKRRQGVAEDGPDRVALRRVSCCTEAEYERICLCSAAHKERHSTT
jgi:hypothetical protein